MKNKIFIIICVCCLMACRYKEKEKPVFWHNDGDRRVIKKYLLLPKKLDNEWRWLEKVKIGQLYRKRLQGLINPKYGRKWVDEAWVDDEWYEKFWGLKTGDDTEKHWMNNKEN